MTEYHSTTNRGVIIDIENNVFLSTPEGFTKTIAEVFSEDNAAAPAPTPKRQLNRGQIEAEIRTQYILQNNIEEIA